MFDEIIHDFHVCFQKSVYPEENHSDNFYWTYQETATTTKVEARFGHWSLQHDRFMLQAGHHLQQLEDWTDTVAGDGGCKADTSNS